MADISVLNRKLGNVKGKITRLENFLDSDKVSATESAILSAKLESVNNVQCALEEIKTSYYATIKDEDYEQCESDLTEVDIRLEEVEVRFKTLIHNAKVVPLKAKTDQVDEYKHSKFGNVRLPEIPLPLFSGSYEDWSLFKSQFLSLIDSNTSLSENQKLYYLQASLRGSAKTIQTCDDTYDSLMKALKDRFENKRIIIDSHISALLSFEKMTHESAKNLRSLIDNYQKHIRALKLLDMDLNKFCGVMLINIVLQKLDSESRKSYELSLTSSEVPEWDAFIEFLEKRTQVLENIERSSLTPFKPKVPTIRNDKAKSSCTKNYIVNNSRMCPICKNNSHAIFKCNVFLKSDPHQRFDIVKKYSLCTNCLSDQHRLSSCQSKHLCSTCNLKHNSLLHREQEVSPHSNLSLPETNQLDSQKSRPDVSASEQLAKASASSLSSCFLAENQTILLSTAIVWVLNDSGNFIPARCILDCGSQSNFMSLDFASKLTLARQPIKAHVSSLGGNITTIKSQVQACLSNGNQSYSTNLNFLLVQRITDMVPATKLYVNNLKFPSKSMLADPNFNCPGKIDLLLGNEVFFELIKSGQIRSSTDNLLFQETVFGYIASGSAKVNDQSSSYCGLTSEISSIENALEKFWQIEEVNLNERILSEESKYCEEHFRSTCKRDANGRYIVQMPMKEVHSLGDSKYTAEKRLKQVNQGLSKHITKQQLYQDFMNEYEELGHMERVEEDRLPENCYYLPHHGVYRPDKTSTKMRVVFNASAATSTGKSLNDILLKGDVIEDIFDIMIRFRIHKYAFCADIKKMFRQIWIDPCQRDYLRIVWSPAEAKEITTFRLKTVTYGTASAPFLAIRTLKQLAQDESSSCPLASEVALRDFYMDDVLSGSPDLETARELQLQLQALMQKGGMELHKWTSNSPQLLNSSADPDHEHTFPIESDCMVKTLGMNWHNHDDYFLFKVDLKQISSYTKRDVLSVIARLYDPLGLLGPVICKAKIFLQKLWLQKLNWVDPLPQAVAMEWLNFISSLKKIESLRIPRWILANDSQVIILHCFADASTEAYGCALYIQCISNDNNASSRLVASKSRVSPLKTISIPRLELSACLLASQLMRKVRQSLNIDLNSIVFYTDSTISLAWIRTSPHLLKTFVANRVSKIQSLTQGSIWKHVPTDLNPADLVSRGSLPQELPYLIQWWEGPHFLQASTIPTRDDVTDSVQATKDSEYLIEIKQTSKMNLMTFKSDFLNNFLNLFNDYSKLINILSYVFRFLGNCQSKTKKRGPLEVSEITASENRLISLVQREALVEDFNSLQNKKEVSRKSVLKFLSPFLDQSNVIRVGGRLREASLSHDTIHPIVLPRGHRIAQLIMLEQHIRNCHIGAQALLHSTRLRFWPIGGRNLARKIVHDCVTCSKINPKFCEQKMGDLPEERINPSFPFNHTGIDFCGPFYIKYKNQRNGALHKIYVAIFICLVTRAIHLEIVSDLTTDSFLASLKRFMARRGKCATIFSDNASNFVGANNELKRLHQLLSNPDELLVSYLNSERINWKFIPPRAPNFGGLWEAGVKSFKFHLKRAVGSLKFTFEEFLTIVNRIEGILNSRPITPLSEDVGDLEALTPAHFLIGRPITAMVEPDLTDLLDNRLNRWQRTTKVTQYLWKRWQRDYLSHLQQRTKWYFSKDNILKGTMVVVKEDNMPISTWLLGKVEELILGKDGKARVFLVKTKLGIIKRPISKLAVLPVNTPDSKS